MSDGTHIEWTDATWNPLRALLPNEQGEFPAKVGWHCERVSPGCEHCYAEQLNKVRFGTGLAYNRKSRDLVTTYLDEAVLTKPLHWRKARRVFVCSMTDLFGEWVPDEAIDRIFAVMALSPQHTFQVLTKRPERMREYLTSAKTRMHIAGEGRVDEPGPWPLPNVWLGTSVEDQQRADERIPELLACPAAVRFLSCEPLLAELHLGLTIEAGKKLTEAQVAELRAELDRQYRGVAAQHGVMELAPAAKYEPLLHWVIVGGESGPGARPCDLAWIRIIVAQCKAAGTACFVKQLGSKPIDPSNGWNAFRGLFSGHGADMAEWPEDLRVREFPQ